MCWNFLKNLPNLLKTSLHIKSLGKPQGFFAFYKKFCYNNYIKHERKDTKYMGNLFHLIPEEDRVEMHNYIEQYAPLEGINQDMVSLQKILRFWEEAKSEHLATMFGGKLILEREIEYEMPIDALVKEFNDNYRSSAFGYYSAQFYSELYTLFHKTPELRHLCDDYRTYYINGKEYYDSVYSYLSRVETLVQNSWQREETIFPLPNEKKFKICPGTKITRILGRLAKEYNLNGWERVREAHAKAMTAKKTKGTLCLSIHPFDYMTMSDNCERWDSCMQWMNKGGYRAGTVEMMNSPYVVVAYLKHPTHKLEDYWNSKIWRELFIVHPELITNIKAYPYYHPWLSQYIATWLKELAENCGFSYYDDECQLWTSEGTNSWMEKNKISVNFRTHAMYNDCGRADQYMYFTTHIPYGHTIHIYYSGIRNCMICGDSNVNFEDEENLLCEDCEYVERYYCEECGCAIPEDEVHSYGDNIYCHDCFHDLYTEAWDDNDNYRPVEDCVCVHIKLPDGKYSLNSVYVYDLGRMADTLGLEKIEEDEDDGVFYVDYDAASITLRWDCGLSSCDQIRLSNRHKTKEETEQLIDSYLDNEHPFEYYLTIAPKQ